MATALRTNRSDLWLGLLALCSVACGPQQGEERGSCYPNGTCNDDLVCLSGVCVLDDRAGEGEGEAGEGEGEGEEGEGEGDGGEGEGEGEAGEGEGEGESAVC